MEGTEVDGGEGKEDRGMEKMYRMKEKGKRREKGPTIGERRDEVVTEHQRENEAE